MKRYSRKREAILTTLRSTSVHPSAEWVYAKLKPEYPDLSLATVYRNINEFLKTGEVISVGVVDAKERFDADISPHSHFICDCCGAIFDLVLDNTDELNRAAESVTGGKVSRHEVFFRGLCSECLDNTDDMA